MNILRACLYTTLLAFCCAMPAHCKPVVFVVNDPQHRDLASFTSMAPLELVQGNTNRIFGSVKIDDSLDLSKQPMEANFDVDLRTLDTGLSMRNEDMRDDFLEVSKYPMATFTLSGFPKPIVLKPGVAATLMAKGTFSLHGINKDLVVPVELVYYPKSPATEQKLPGADLIQINAEFPVLFDIYNIKRPEVLFQKLADRVTVKVSATAFNMIGKPTVIPKIDLSKPKPAN